MTSIATQYSQSLSLSYSQSSSYSDASQSVASSTQVELRYESTATAEKDFKFGDKGREHKRPDRLEHPRDHNGHGHFKKFHPMQIVQKALERGYQHLQEQVSSASIPGTLPGELLSNSTSNSTSNSINQYIDVESSIDQKPTAEQVAENILGFVGSRLESAAADGATPEALKSLMDQAYEGFQKGFADATEQLKAMDMLTPDVESDIGKTYDLVMQGLKDFGEKYIGVVGSDETVDSVLPPTNLTDTAQPEVALVDAATAQTLQPLTPVADNSQEVLPGLIMPEDSSAENSVTTPGSAPVNSTVSDSGLEQIVTVNPPELNPAAINQPESSPPEINPPESNPLANFAAGFVANKSYSYGAYDEMNFQLTTQDGDVVTINFADTKAYAEQSQRVYGVTTDGFYSQKSYANAYYQNTEFAFSVEGNLDDGELTAITDLLKQVQKVAGKFFDGDPQKAYKKALEIGFDSQEIAGYSLNLTRIEVVEANRSYSAVAQIDPATGEDSESASPAVNPFEALGHYVKDLLDAAKKAGAFAAPQDLLMGAMRAVEDQNKLEMTDNGDVHSLQGFADFNLQLLKSLYADNEN